MAKRASRASRGAAPARQTRSRRAAAAPAAATPTAIAEVEVVEESGGMGVDAGIAIATFVILLAAILFVDAYLGAYGTGLFFK